MQAHVSRLHAFFNLAFACTFEVTWTHAHSHMSLRSSFSCSTHAQIVARLHGLYDSETKLIRRVDEVEGRVEKAKAKVVEEEAALAGVQGELQGVKDQIMATLKEEAECRERTRKEDTDSDVMEDGVNIEEAGSSEEVGAEIEMGKKEGS